jgi:uncharacterized membrane protein
MILWGALVGAVLGWVLAEFEGYGLVLGLLVGSAVGWAGRRAVRSEIEAATRDLRAQVMALTDLRPAGPIVVPEQVATAPRVVRVAESRTVPPPEWPAFEAAASPADTEERFAPEPRARHADAAGAAWGAVTGWFLGGNTIVRVGLVILFVGLSFLARYAAAAGLFPIELRLGLVAAVGVALLAVGFRTRVKRPGFALALQGTGVAAIYLTIFAGARLFGLLPPVLAYGLMIAVCAIACALALVQNAQVLAVASFAGGFAVPLLLGRGEGGTAALFSYYTLLNLAVLFIAGRRSWRAVNLVGFFATFGAAAAWGAAFYEGADYPVAQPFLAVSVLIYVAAAALYARNTPGRHGHVVDATLLFGPALAGFALQVGMVERWAMGAAWSAVAFGALYLLLAAGTRRRQGFEVLHGGALAIGVGFLTLAVPLAAGAVWTSAAWAVEGAGAVWVGARQRRWGPRAFGLALQAAAALVFIADFDGNVSAVPLVNGAFLGAMLIAAAALATAWWLRRRLPDGETALARRYGQLEATLGAPVFLLGFAAWVAAWTIEANRALPGGGPVFDASMQRLLAMLAFVLGAWGAAAVGRRAQWAVATWPSLATLPVLVLAFVAGLFAGAHVLDLPDLAIWVGAIAVHMRLVQQNDQSGAEPRLIRATLAGGVLLGTAMLADCIRLGLDRAGAWDTSWPGVAFVGAGTAVLALLTWGARPGRKATPGWPIDWHPSAFLWNAAAPIAAIVLAGAGATALGASGRVDPVPFVPLLNPVDLTLAAAAATLFWWRRVALSSGHEGATVAALRGGGAVAALAGLAFLTVTGAWLRTAHHLAGVPWEGDALAGSFVVQTGLAILWTLLALALTTYAHRRRSRNAWLAGAGLLGLVVVKLALVDLMNAGGAERIVTFIAVGGLMLVVGYLAPLPPRASARAPG